MTASPFLKGTKFDLKCSILIILQDYNTVILVQFIFDTCTDTGSDIVQSQSDTSYKLHVQAATVHSSLDELRFYLRSPVAVYYRGTLTVSYFFESLPHI